MAEANDSDKGAPSTAPSTDSNGSTGGAVGVEALSADERKLRLKRAVFDRTREARGTLESQGEFEATIVRGQPVNHTVHLTAVVVMAILAVVVSQGFGSGIGGLILALAVPVGYAVFWLFLTETGGMEHEHVSVDEQGRVASVKTGRDVEARGDFLRVALPLIVIAVSGFLVVSLVHDITFPPPPHCNINDPSRPEACLSIPNIGQLIQPSQGAASPSSAPGDSGAAATPSASSTPSPTPSVAPSATAFASASAASGDTSTGFSVEETKTVERVVRTFELLFALVPFLGGIWFLRRMRSGKWVAFVRPIHHRAGDE